MTRANLDLRYVLSYDLDQIGSNKKKKGFSSNASVFKEKKIRDSGY
jgi:hypothetical protein